MLTLLAASVIAAPHTPAIDLSAITPERARELHGCRVRAAFTVGAPPFSVAGMTLLGPGEVDEVERLAVIPETFKYDKGDHVTVEGTLTVTRVPAKRFRAVLVPAYTEVRVVQP